MKECDAYRRVSVTSNEPFTPAGSEVAHVRSYVRQKERSRGVDVAGGVGESPCPSSACPGWF